MLNKIYEDLPTFPFQAARNHEEMPQEKPILDILLRVTGEVVISGGTTSPGLKDAQAEVSTARIISRLRHVWDKHDILPPLTGRQLLELHRANTGQPLTGNFVATGVGTHPIDFTIILPSSRYRFVSDPMLVHLPILPVSQSHRIEIDWETSVNGGTGTEDAGSGAFFDGAGDRDIALNDFEATVTVIQANTTKQLKPWYLPQVGILETIQFSAAFDTLPIELKRSDPYIAKLIQCVEGADETYADLINSITFRSGATRWIDDIAYELLHDEERWSFPGREDAPVGNLFLLMGDGGKLGNAIVPGALSNPRLEFDVTAPAAAPGLIQALFMELNPWPDITVMGSQTPSR